MHGVGHEGLPGPARAVVADAPPRRAAVSRAGGQQDHRGAYKDYAGLRGYSAFASLTNRATTCTALRGLVPPKWAGMSARRWRSTASWRIPTLISCRKPRSAAVVACRSAGPDPGEEDVGRPVFGQRRRHGEDGGEAAASQG